MKTIKEFLIEKVANVDLKCTNGKITQVVRNNLKNEMTNILFDHFKKELECEEIIVERIKGAIGIGINNDKLGLIPIEISGIFKNLDEDIIEKGIEYQDELKAKAVKEKEKQAKAEKRKPQ